MKLDNSENKKENTANAGAVFRKIDVFILYGISFKNRLKYHTICVLLYSRCCTTSHKMLKQYIFFSIWCEVVQYLEYDKETNIISAHI
jgi:hypothetical protein